MIDDVLKEIREAEAQADEIVSEAQNKAKQIVQQAEIDAEKQKKATVLQCRDDRRVALDKAEANAAKKARRNPQKRTKIRGRTCNGPQPCRKRKGKRALQRSR